MEKIEEVSCENCEQEDEGVLISLNLDDIKSGRLLLFGFIEEK